MNNPENAKIAFVLIYLKDYTEAFAVANRLCDMNEVITAKAVTDVSEIIAIVEGQTNDEIALFVARYVKTIQGVTKVTISYVREPDPEE